ncbi:hypothetical protein XNC1_p0080 (plasmid) [Xenorhabdus nematophila ATCC 19061]|uniref:Pesticidal crystal protein N-terminal domain-containing protein n=1 Tax=Xenorhabdus nematophila (strain ATCC 19061 / DSM 3370 / CCUG 14189 / LMG 1036 / NCIMB 9965 / AN6) TaxID=406817 RepID=D3VLZ6_XENNA|nr:insecticidal delta-endotoxin Cry8Ea1 family protein [Xenorhabdus nematophila]CBJ92948.1 hypothetical protein XNC1_p0080 [Xenorhabdus nematophila ATCC 19061]CEK25563.1 conserved protein of unknown function [Xenorhabdus nematophila AN6/1]
MNDDYAEKNISPISIETPEDLHIAITAITGIAVAITGPFFPLTSAIIATSLAIFPVLFKPENKVDVFDTISNSINSLIDQKIDQAIYDNSKQHLIGIANLFEGFSKELKEWEENKTIGTETIRREIYYLDNELTSSMPLFQHPKQRGSLLPLFANAAYRHITLLYTAITYYDELNFNDNIEPSSRVTKNHFIEKIKKLIKEYSDYSCEVYNKELNKITYNDKKTWIDLNEYRNICTSSVHAYIMMLDFFNPEIYPLDRLVDKRGYYRVIQNVVKDTDFDRSLSTRQFDKDISNHYAVGKLYSIEFGKIDRLYIDPYTVRGLVYTLSTLKQFNDITISIGNKLNNVHNSEKIYFYNKELTGVKGIYPLYKQHNSLITPTVCLQEMTFKDGDLPTTGNEIHLLFVRDPKDYKLKFKEFKLGRYLNVSDYLDVKDELEYLKDIPQLLFMKTLTGGDGSIRNKYNTINIFGWRFKYFIDFKPSTNAFNLNEMKTQIYYSITSSKYNKDNEIHPLDRDSIISNLGFSQGAVVRIRKDERIIFLLAKSDLEPNRWIFPGDYKIRLWHIKVKNAKVNISISQTDGKGNVDCHSINMELNNHDMKDDIEDEYIYSDLCFKQTDNHHDFVIKDNIYQINILIKNISTNKVIIDRIELIPVFTSP